MNQQNNNLTSEEAAERLKLVDLPVADEQADAICGGEETIIPPRRPGGTGFVNNHNEVTLDDEEEEASFTDLSLTDEELDGIKGGPICHGVSVLGWARVDGVSPQSNHNETVSYDEADLDQFDDLLVDDEQAKAVHGGSGTTLPTRPPGGGGYVNNHNETVAEDEANALETGQRDYTKII